MAQVIIYQNPTGTNVCVCIPTGELDIQTVLAKDCPTGAIIIDDSALPQGSDAQFFDAWVLNGSTVSVNFAKAQSDRLDQYNSAALTVANQRNLNTLAGIANAVADADWAAQLTTDRASIAAATTTAGLVAIANPA
jgi:hypothetical protein